MNLDQSVESSQNATMKLDSLYSKQRNLLELLQIHQRNLEKLSLQQARVGIIVPLQLMNEVDHQQAQISEIERKLAKVDNQINAITHKAMEGDSSEGQRLTLNVDGVDYAIECAFPALGSTSKILADGSIQAEYYYAGGFEVHALMKSKIGMEITFYRHGRRVIPTIDQEVHKIVLPIGISIVVNAVATNMLHMETIENITPERIAEGSWTIISPGKPQQPVIKVDWPQGYKGYIMTTKIPFEGSYELWMVQTCDSYPGGSPLTLWFYINDWNVAPVIDEGQLSLKFPDYISS